MKSFNFIRLLTDPNLRNFRYGLIASISLCLLSVFRSSLVILPHNEKIPPWGVTDSQNTLKLNNTFYQCKTQCRDVVSEALPKGIITKTSSLELKPLWGSPKENKSDSINLFAAAVGIKQKDLVHEMVTKFVSSNFVVILFHYDGNVDEWKSFDWNEKAIHVSANNQTKWWFAKRFLHPDIVAEYSYIFLWDEDLGVQYFDPARYISIIQREGLEISQPALDRAKSLEVHHQITLRGRRSAVHRRVYKKGNVVCDNTSRGPPCTGWVEVMAPVFSKAAWRCVWHMIQNDLIHGWGLDYVLGYCAQGDRMKNVGVVDSEYIIHLGRPTLGATIANETLPLPRNSPRVLVRRQATVELKIFQRRWKKAIEEDNCWVDPFQ